MVKRLCPICDGRGFIDQEQSAKNTNEIREIVKKLKKQNG